CPQPGACCFFGGNCTMLQATACASRAGVFRGRGSSCRPNPCPQLIGDMNCDGVVNMADLTAFVLALLDPVAYAWLYQGCNIGNGDFNGDGQVDAMDIPALDRKSTRL